MENESNLLKLSSGSHFYVYFHQKLQYLDLLIKYTESTYIPIYSTIFFGIIKSTKFPST